ncbi:hypothetical protein PybrP1_003272 [[Pythium] brassicae (nom. inval.)]|nr:hypothetical protein PybrP1_003272 [[Pythium] brassicae (nom. inval.)]
MLSVNLISLLYMQFTCSFRLVVLPGQHVMWLEKPSLKLKFVERNGLFRVKTKRVLRKHALAVHMDESASTELLHSRFGHASTDVITKMLKQGIRFAVKGKARFLHAVDEATRYKWAYLTE